MDPDGKISFDTSQGFRIYVDLIQIEPTGIIEGLHARSPLLGGSLASVSDLLLFRAVTVMDRGADGDVLDFKWLLSKVSGAEDFPAISAQELDDLCGAVGFCVGGGLLGRLVVAGLIGTNNLSAAMHLLA